MKIPRIGRVIMIWYEVFFRLISSFDGMVIRKEVLLEYSQIIETHLDVVVEVIEVNISVTLSSLLIRSS